jgi:hypothetical protein
VAGIPADSQPHIITRRTKEERKAIAHKMEWRRNFDSDAISLARETQRNGI